mmetsp:Transcript_78507/g.243500  ORF Transcript_78507/g.243500 Transcript_78507/m.243500 type:complete len:1110 (+) Transcript_78507:45-3374(+)
MAIHQAKKEIPWCTIFLVTGAIVSHTLVLSGNLATSSAMKALGTSTGGWSDVGSEVAKSLDSELDKIMTNVTGVLSKAISALIKVQSALDTVLGLAGAVTDSSLAGYMQSMINTRKKLSGLGLGLIEVHPPPDWAAKMEAAHKRGERSSPAKRPEPGMADTVEAGAFLEEEVVFMGQTGAGQPVVNALDPTMGLRSPSEIFGEEEEESLLPSWDVDSVEHLTSHVMDGAMYIWSEARGRAQMEAWSKNQSANLSSYPNPKEFKVALKMALHELVIQMTKECDKVLQKLFVLIRPALLQIGKWVITFGSKVTDKLESFMSSVDNVQKIFDQIMAKLSRTSGVGKDQMIFESYNLFDASHAGFISTKDLQSVGKIYGINALEKSAADAMFRKYDANADGKMMQDEFNLFVDDKQVPNIMSTVLRYFSKKLSTVAGNVRAARYRDEVAKAVVEYFALVCAQNRTKVSWVSNRLINHSLPDAFSADILVVLAQNADNPDQLTTVDIGAIVVREMLKQDTTYVGQLLQLMADPVYWSTEGWQAKDQPKFIARVTSWVSNTPYALDAFRARDSTSTSNGTILLQLDEAAEETSRVELSSEQIQNMPSTMHDLVVERQKTYQRSRVIAKRLETLRRPVTPTVRALQRSLPVMSLAADPAAEAAVHKGVLAVPATLQFAEFLANNATATANTLVDLCFDYSSESSSTLDSFAVQIKNMVKKVQNFISLMETYSGPEGIKRIEDQISNFTLNAASDIMGIMEKSVDASIDEFMNTHNFSAASGLVEDTLKTLSVNVTSKKVTKVFNLGLVQGEAVDEFEGGGEVETANADDSADFAAPSGAAMIAKLSLGSHWSILQYTMSMLSSALPSVIEDLKYARKEVSAVSSTLSSIFGTFKIKGPPIFDLVSKLYKTLWVAYYIVFATLTSGVLFYGMWASGFCGGPHAAENVEGEEWYEHPSGFSDRCRICCRCCDGCLRGCMDSHLCFWSVIIFAQIIVLVLFVISIVLCLLAGIQAFIVAGCAEVYMLGDGTLCTGTLQTVQTFLISFLVQSNHPLSQACDKRTLLTCQLIGSKMSTAAMFTIIGSLLAAVFSFQMITESAILHERVRWRRIFDEESKRT